MPANFLEPLDQFLRVGIWEICLLSNQWQLMFIELY